MATRNRTPLFRKYRDALKSVRAPSTFASSSSSSGSGPVIELANAGLFKQNSNYAPLSTEDPGTSSNTGALTVGLPPAWVDVSDEITGNVQRARAKMAELAKAHAKALMPSFGDGREDQHRIEGLTHEITDLLRKSEKKLKKLSAGGTSEDSNIRKNVQRSLATDLQSLSVELRKKQSTYLKRLQQQKEYKFINSTGTIVDRIDHNIQNVAASVDEGLKQLQKAERSQKRGGMIMCATVLVIMCFVMLVLLILKEILF
ncbi:hypothetical protein M8C21_033916 [Ambrosia artemisiifolia]|uniref:t-SNARE coiled-coil homology domain-containing protein n=1 Tax=Ambrosia artemisiifolia TaxID=4212 RepID=A0AAD5GFT5_AMBAR|nr:hypothetical protein M8C21_033916 [Ambrosia artemisiifolia]